MSKEKLLSLFKTYRYSSLAVITSLGVLGYAYFRGSNLEEIDAKIQEQQSTLSNYKQNITSSAKLSDQIEQIDKNIAKIKGRAAPADNYALNLKHFYKLETDSGVKIANISKVDESKLSKGPKISAIFNINIEGPYQNVLKFITTAEKSVHYGKISSYTLSAGGNRSSEEASSPKNTEDANCNLSIELYTGPGPATK